MELLTVSVWKAKRRAMKYNCVTLLTQSVLHDSILQCNPMSICVCLLIASVLPHSTGCIGMSLKRTLQVSLWAHPPRIHSTRRHSVSAGRPHQARTTTLRQTRAPHPRAALGRLRVMEARAHISSRRQAAPESQAMCLVLSTTDPSARGRR